MDIYKINNEYGIIIEKKLCFTHLLYYVKILSLFPPKYAWISPKHQTISLLSKAEEKAAMKKIAENLKSYLKQQQNQQKLVIYCDMDGVLVNFADVIMDLLRKEFKNPKEENKKFVDEHKKLSGSSLLARDDIKPEKNNIALRKVMFNLMSDNYKLWATLPWMKDGKELWEFIKQFEPLILTAPPDWSAIKGKKIWIEKNLNIPLERAFFEEKKSIYATSNAVLIDDFSFNTEPFIKAGGKAILHTDAKSTIEALLKLFSTSH